MSISHKLDMRQGQSLVMTPQLQQAIKLLQLTNLELAEFVEGQLQENPFLEVDESANGPQRGDEANTTKDAGEDDASGERELTLKDGDVALEAVTTLDTDYSNVDPEASISDTHNESTTSVGEGSTVDWSTAGQRKSNDFGDFDLNENLAYEKTLHEHLTEQLQVSLKDPADMLVGAHLIDLIDEAGYLRVDSHELAERLGITFEDIERIIQEIQLLDPIGVGARDLAECLQLQLQDKDRYDPAMAVFLENLDLLAKADINALCKATGADAEDIQDMVAEIRRLNPKPGLVFGAESVQLAIPDVYVRQAEDGGWKVELNTDTLPSILANQRYYAKLTKECVLDNEKSYLSEQMSNANWLIKSLDQRARTILKVGSEIVRQQDAFFVYGVRHLKPLNLKTVADAISMHESTVSRVTANKYISTPRGLFEMKYFFTSAIASSAGGVSHSAESVRDRIREMIEREEVQAVLSDDKIVAILHAENINIARRTVAKYREALNIPSSVQRRRLKRKAF